MSLKTSDLHTVPLCEAHHGEFHKNGEVRPFDAASTELLFTEAMVDSLASALELGLRL